MGPERLDGHDYEHDEAARLHDALTSTTAIVDPDDDECEQQFERMEAGLEAFRAAHEGEGSSEDVPPSVTTGRAAYLRQCRSRPALEQHCLSQSYRTHHAAECQRASDARAREGDAMAHRARTGEPVATGRDPHAGDPPHVPAPRDDLSTPLP